METRAVGDPVETGIVLDGLIGEIITVGVDPVEVLPAWRVARVPSLPQLVTKSVMTRIFTRFRRIFFMLAVIISRYAEHPIRDKSSQSEKLF